MVAFTVKYIFPVLLTVLAAAASAIAGANSGPVRVYWILGSLAALAGATVLTVLRNWRADSAEEAASTAQEAAAEAQAKQATALTSAGHPLITELADLCGAPSREYLGKVRTLRSRIIAVAKVECARRAEQRQRVRATYYEFAPGALEVLEKQLSEGRDDTSPRESYVWSKEQDRAMIEVARGQRSLLVPNLTAGAPAGFRPEDFDFKALVAVPVRAGGQGIGLLTVDSEEPDVFTSVEEGYARLLAGLLAAGIAQGSRASVPEEPSVPPARGNGESSTKNGSGTGTTAGTIAGSEGTS